MGPRVRTVVKRFDSGQTTRLNSGHWGTTTDTSVNSLISNYLTTVRGRANYEAQNNPIVEGVLGTFSDDVVGCDGPILQVSASGPRYVRQLERLWRTWWEQPDVNGVLSGPDWLSLCVRLYWTCGEHLTQIVNDETADGPQLRLRAIHPRRLDTPLKLSGSPDVILGVRRTQTGRPTAYFVLDENINQTGYTLLQSHSEIPAEQIIHDFALVEPDQARGIPWLTSALQPIADLRDYTDQVMDAARAAADMSVLLYTRHPEANLVTVNETTEIERRTMSTLPPGWEATQITPTQPSTQYGEFVAERLRSLGRPVGMPLMMIELDSRNHNYSSARFDSQIYQRTVRKLQGRLARRILNRLVNLLAREAELGGQMPARPDDLELNWIWPRFPHVDPAKEANAAETRLRIGITSLADECAAENKDWELVAEQRKAVMEAYEAAGLPLPEWLVGKTPAAAESQTQTDDQADDVDDEDVEEAA